MFALPELPFAYDALEPVMSARAVHLHHDKHHATYVKTLNALLAKAGVSPTTLEAVIRAAARTDEHKLFNNAAQAWNHSFFWACMTRHGEAPSGALANAIDEGFNDVAGLRAAFVTEGVGRFGSGWVWLAADRTGRLKVLSTHDADDILTHQGMTPLLVCDLWEHAYYLDHQNDRKGFLEAWFDALPGWRFAGDQHAAAMGNGEPWRHPEPRANATGPILVGAA